MDCVYLTDAEYVKDFNIHLTFNDGKSGIVNLKELVFQHDVAAPLKDQTEFSKFYLDSWPTLAWECGFDIAPESLYKRCEPEH